MAQSSGRRPEVSAPRPEVHSGEEGAGEREGGARNVKTYFLQAYTKADLSNFPVYALSKQPFFRAIGVTDFPVTVSSVVKTMDGDQLVYYRGWVDFNPLDDLVEHYNQNRSTEKQRDAVVDEWFISRIKQENVKELVTSLQAQLKTVPKVGAIWSAHMVELKKLHEASRSRLSSRLLALKKRYKRDVAALKKKRSQESAKITKELKKKYEAKLPKGPDKDTLRLQIENLKRQGAEAKLKEYEYSEEIVRTHGSGPYDFDDTVYHPILVAGKVMIVRSNKKSLGTL